MGVWRGQAVRDHDILPVTALHFHMPNDQVTAVAATNCHPLQRGRVQRSSMRVAAQATPAVGSQLMCACAQASAGYIRAHRPQLPLIIWMATPPQHFNTSTGAHGGA